MPGVLLKNLPARLHQRLRMRAAHSHRSLSSETIVILEEALDERAGPRSLAEVDGLRQVGARPLTDALVRRARRQGRP